VCLLFLQLLLLLLMLLLLLLLLRCRTRDYRLLIAALIITDHRRLYTWASFNYGLPYIRLFKFKFNLLFYTHTHTTHSIHTHTGSIFPTLFRRSRVSQFSIRIFTPLFIEAAHCLLSQRELQLRGRVLSWICS